MDINNINLNYVKNVGGTIYIVKLEEDFMFVGITILPIEDKINDILKNRKGSTWFELYKPLSIVKTIEGDRYKQIEIIKRLQEKYGVSKVIHGVREEIPTKDGSTIYKPKVAGLTPKKIKKPAIKIQNGHIDRLEKNINFLKFTKEFQID